MFIFEKLKQKAKRDMKEDKLLNLLPKLLPAEPSRSTLLTHFYQDVQKKIAQGSWPKISKLYQQDIAYIRKNQAIWNYKDISVIQKNLKKSMSSGTLSFFILIWTNEFGIFVLKRLSQFGNMEPNENKSDREKKQLISEQIRIFVEYLWHIFFQIYSHFFVSHSLSKKNRQIKNQSEVFHQYSQYFQYLIRNLLTETELFKQLYVGFDKLFNGTLTQQKVGEFQKFMEHKLQIIQLPQHVYRSTFPTVSLFLKEPEISKKLSLAFQIHQKIEADHRRYFQKTKKSAKKQEESIKRLLLMYIFKRMAVNVKTSLLYIMSLLYKPNKLQFKKLPLEYKNRNTQNIHLQQSNFNVILEQFCLLWIHEEAQCEISIVLDVMAEIL